MHTRVLEISFDHLIVYRYNDLFLEEAFGGHIDIWLQFIIATIDNLLYLVNFLVLKVQECFLDLQDVYCNV